MSQKGGRQLSPGASCLLSRTHQCQCCSKRGKVQGQFTTNTVQLCSAEASFAQGEHIRRQNKEYEIRIYASLYAPTCKLMGPTMQSRLHFSLPFGS